MQAPLRNGRKETLGRARGVKRTGRSLLLLVLMIGLVVVSGLTYTRERMEVEQLLLRCARLERQIKEVQQSIDLLTFQVASLEDLSRIEKVAQETLGMTPIDWKNVYVLGPEKVMRR